KKAQEIGFKICPINTGPYLIMEFPFSNDNKEEDHLHIAMRPLYDNYCKEEYIFGIKKSEIFGELTLEGTEVKGNEKVWNPDSKFVFCLPLIRS
ncbi:MAG: hypothetical protein PHE29_14620, partial [Tissierellia bacterium]|nr:hypothetical protein [Tissierellia bacterium]